MLVPIRRSLNSCYKLYASKEPAWMVYRALYEFWPVLTIFWSSLLFLVLASEFEIYVACWLFSSPGCLRLLKVCRAWVLLFDCDYYSSTPWVNLGFTDWVWPLSPLFPVLYCCCCNRLWGLPEMSLDTLPLLAWPLPSRDAAEPVSCCGTLPPAAPAPNVSVPCFLGLNCAMAALWLKPESWMFETFAVWFLFSESSLVGLNPNVWCSTMPAIVYV